MNENIVEKIKELEIKKHRKYFYLKEPLETVLNYVENLEGGTWDNTITVVESFPTFVCWFNSEDGIKISNDNVEQITKLIELEEKWNKENEKD